MVRGFRPVVVEASVIDDWPAFIAARKQHLYEVLYDGLRVRPSDS
jgi:hypothetical protein